MWYSFTDRNLNWRRQNYETTIAKSKLLRKSTAPLRVMRVYAKAVVVDQAGSELVVSVYHCSKSPNKIKTSNNPNLECDMTNNVFPLPPIVNEKSNFLVEGSGFHPSETPGGAFPHPHRPPWTISEQKVCSWPYPRRWPNLPNAHRRTKRLNTFYQWPFWHARYRATTKNFYRFKLVYNTDETSLPKPAVGLPCCFPRLYHKPDEIVGQSYK